jgi:hypothetical protein
MNRKKLRQIGMKGSDILIGDKRLEMPNTVGDCSKIFKEFQLKNVHVSDEAFFPNARRLVELNNEIYGKLKSCVMRYKVTKSIPKEGPLDEGAQVDDILTVGWYETGCCWALYNGNGQYVCDLTSTYGTRYCQEIAPNAK